LQDGRIAARGTSAERQFGASRQGRRRETDQPMAAAAIAAMTTDETTLPSASNVPIAPPTPAHSAATDAVNPRLRAGRSVMLAGSFTIIAHNKSAKPRALSSTDRQFGDNCARAAATAALTPEHDAQTAKNN